MAEEVALNGSGTIATFTPSATLADNTTYTATLTTAITDNAAKRRKPRHPWIPASPRPRDRSPETGAEEKGVTGASGLKRL